MTLNTQRVLLVEDDKPLRVTLAATLRAEGYAIVEAGSLADAKQRISEAKVDLIVLDLGLPDGDGMNLLSDLRKSGDFAPVLVLTARGDEAAKVAALDLGADDYVTQPFGVPELLARIRSALRHGVQIKGAPPIVRTGDVQIDLASRLVSKAGREIKMPRKEFDLLAELALHQGRPVSHRRLLESVWGSADTDIRYLRSYVGQVREKIEVDPAHPALLVSVAGFGYRLT